MKKILQFVFTCLSILLVFLSVFFLCARLIPLNLAAQAEKITLYDKNQQVFYETNFHSEMEWTSFEEYPKTLVDLVVEIEDKRFYHHLGFDPIRISKALLENLSSFEIREGGSSITQQLAKNLFLTNEQTFTRKMKELFYAVQMEMQYSKEHILEAYLNSVYFGHGIYGFNSASTFFFGMPLSELSISQLVLLIGIINGPSLYSPRINETLSLERRNLLLGFLHQQNFLSDQEFQTAINEPIILASQEKEQDFNDYYIQAVLDELHQKKIDLTQGLEVYTSYDPDAQKALSHSIQEKATKDDLQSSGILLNPQDGGVLALMGGKDYAQSQYIRPLYSKRQVGSSIKPLLYYQALHHGFTPSTTFLSTATTFQIDETTAYAPTNFSSRYPEREISMINAIAVSDNIYAMKTHLFLGMHVLSNSLNDFGIKAQPIPSLALGTCEMTLLELAKIYNTFASGGTYHEPYFIKAIYSNQNLVYEHQNQSIQMLDYEETLILNQLLLAPFDIKARTIFIPTLVNIKSEISVAAKSGTSDFDSLIVGYNPDYTIAIWSGFDDARILNSEYFEISKHIFRSVMDSLYVNERKGGWYMKTRNIESRIVDPVSGEENMLGSEYWYKK